MLKVDTNRAGEQDGSHPIDRPMDRSRALTLFSTACQDGSSVPDAVSHADSAESVVAAAAPPNQAPVAKTQHGPVRGFLDNQVRVFKGIRYGADTVTTRFAPPKTPTAWPDTADAIAFGPACPQAKRGSLSLFESWLPEPDPGMSEDCLFLNVWTPAVDRGTRPVMVWLHGGGFTSGSGSSNAYDGARLADRGDVVIVSVNHRLNVFGYTHLDPYGDQYAGSGNAGMLDLVSALTWVKDNISSFGGDPDNVLIFGESGGG